MGEISPLIRRWLENRGIGAATVADLGIYSGQRRHTGDGFEVVSDPVGGDVVVFPYFRHGQVLREKYRESRKKFYQKPGGQSIFYNADVLDDPQLVEGRVPLVIVEGELDCAAVKEAGNPFVVSVPDGAPPPRDFDDENDSGELKDGGYEYILHEWSVLKKIKRIIIATDSDPPGQQLAEELVRRLGRARCSFVSFPQGCKDMNEVLVKSGPGAVAELIARARPYPVSGIYTYEELPNEPDLQPMSTGFFRLDNYLRVFYPALMVVTGFASSGKSTWVNQMVGQLALQHKWKIGIASFEMRVKPFVTDTLLSVYRESNNPPRYAYDWLNRNFVFIAPEPGEEDSAFDIDWLIEKAIAAVVRYGIRVLVIDPWNEIEHAVRRMQSLTDYTGKAIRALKRFGREFECLVIVVAHPTKSASNKEPADVTLYDVSDCYSSDTDVLTRRGWLPFPQVTLADEIACFNMESGGLLWGHPSRVIRQSYEGQMAHFKGRSFDLLVTPNHRMVVMPAWNDPAGTQAITGIGRPVEWEKEKWQFCLPSELSCASFLIPIAPGLEEEGCDPGCINLDQGYKVDDFVDFLGWYLAEGHQTTSSIALSQGKRLYVTEIRGLLQKMGLDVHESIASSVGIHPLATMDTLSFYIRKRHSSELVEWMRAHCGTHSYNKKIPESVYDLPSCLKRRLIEAFIRGDGVFFPRGSRRELAGRATTTSPFLCDGLQRLAVECGVSCTIGPSRQLQPHHRPSWDLSFTFGRAVVGLDRRSGHLKWEYYKGDIYCLTVPTGAFMVRRNGRPVVSGNSAHFANKADFGVVVARVGGDVDCISEVFVKKVRYQPQTGKPGSVTLIYDPVKRVFSQ